MPNNLNLLSKVLPKSNYEESKVIRKSKNVLSQITNYRKN